MRSKNCNVVYDSVSQVFFTIQHLVSSSETDSSVHGEISFIPGEESILTKDSPLKLQVNINLHVSRSVQCSSDPNSHSSRKEMPKAFTQPSQPQTQEQMQVVTETHPSPNIEKRRTKRFQAVHHIWDSLRTGPSGSEHVVASENHTDFSFFGNLTRMM